jgi:hypothetical protein
MPGVRSMKIFPARRIRRTPAREGGFEMATEKEQKPQEKREADKQGRFERKPANPNEPREGMPGYGQPPDEVREKQLPDQKW